MVQKEILNKSTQAKNSITEALLWLKRAVGFHREFLREFLTGEEDLVKVSKKAYELTLKTYHGWMVQGIFSLAMKAVPHRDNFIKRLTSAEYGTPNVKEEQLLSDVKSYVEDITRITDILQTYYLEKNLDNDTKV
ncbi:unnamed protein product [Owenia fusiformis]|nr:unnamed protein product [Owenia fusiformis]